MMDEVYLEALVEVLLFAGNTAALLAHRELWVGRAGKGLKHLARIANDSNELLRFIKESTKAGEPASDVRH